MSDIEKEPLPQHPSMFNNITEPDLDFSKIPESDVSFDQRITKASKRSIILTVFNTFRSFVAIGVLTLPYAVKLVGPIIAFMSLLIVAVVIYITTKLVIEVADDSKFKGANYETLGKLLWGNIGQNIILTSLYICSIATFMGGILFTVEFLDFAFCNHGVDKLCGSKYGYLFVAFILSFFISFISSLRPFGYISIGATMVVIISLLSITVYNFNFLATTEEDLTSRLGMFKIKNFFAFLGIALYTTEGIGLILPIRASFKDNRNFMKVFTGTFIFIVWFYIMIGVFSYIVD